MIKNTKVLSGKGKEWSDAAESITILFTEWLAASGITDVDFFNKVETDTFEIEFLDNENQSLLMLKNKDGMIGIPFSWSSENGIPKKDFLTDAGLLMLYIAATCKNKKSIKKLNKFVHNYVI